MGIGRWYLEPTNLDRELDRIGALQPGDPAELNREHALELLAEVTLLRGKLKLAERQAIELRARLEDAGLIPRR